MDNLNELKNLKNCIPSKNIKRAIDIIELVEQCIHQNITTAETAFALQKLFDNTDGTLGFLIGISENMSANGKLFEKCIKHLLKLYAQWIQDFSIAVKNYANAILDVVFKYMKSSHVDAKVKELAALVIFGMVETKILSDEDVSKVLVTMLQSYSDSKNIKVYCGRVLLQTMGLISRYFPSIAMTHHTTIRNALRQTIEIRLVQKNYLSFTLLSGAFQSLTDYLYNFPPNHEIDEEIDLGLTYYKYVKMMSLCSPGEGKDASRKALTLFTVHYQLFHDQIFEDVQHWHKTLKEWVASDTYDDKNIGIYATHSFHMSLAMTLDARKSDDDAPMLRNLIQGFRRTLINPEANFNATRIAVRGFGTLSKACRLLLDPTFLDEILTLVLQRIRYTDYKDDAQKSKKLLEHLPDYVHSLSEIMTNMEQLSAIQLTYLENIIVEMMRDFYYLSQVHHELLIVSLLRTLSNVQKMSEHIFSDFLERIVFQGVVWACDKCLIYDQEWSEERDWKENVTFRSYLPLWFGLLSTEKVNPAFDRPKIAKKVLNVLLSTLFQVIGKLNFTTQKRTYKDDDGADQEFNFCDPNIDLVPVKPQDFHIFINLVDFYVEILKQLSVTAKKETIIPWLSTACDQLIQKILQYPLVSGFVKLLEVMIKIGKETEYFKNTSTDSGFHTLQSMLCAFLKQIVQRVTQSTAELQLSYLKLIFVYPVTLLKSYVRKMGDVYVIALEFGKNLPVLWIASMALRSLDELIEEMDVEKRKNLLKHVMPSLESFLSSSGDATLSNIKTEIVKPKQGKRTNIRRRFEIKDGAETELIKFQKRIVMFLGKLSLEECQYMLERDPQSLELMKWEPQNHLAFQIQANVFQLDLLIPRISHLALNSSDRKTKIAACELLHTIIIFLLGTNKLSTVIWTKLCPKIIVLGCDSDAAVQEIYEPLLYQIVHYLSKPDLINHGGTQTFIEALLHLITHPNNNSIQDLSAKLLREFVSWTLRHIPRERQGSTPTNLKTLFQRLQLYCTNADTNKCKAAILAFNNLYRITRNERGIISELWLDLFYCYCTNYVMTENFYLQHQQTPGLEQNNVALDSFIKVFITHKAVFDAKDPNRKFPAVFDKDEMPLKSVAMWILRQCGSVKQRNYRIKCIEMFSLLAKTLSMRNSLADFILQENINLPQVFEEANGQGLNHHPTFDSFMTKCTMENLQLWLSILLTALDGYHWILDKKLVVSIDDLFLPTRKFIIAIQDFLQKIAFSNNFSILMQNLYQTSADTSPESDEIHLDLYEKENVKTIKQEIIIRVVEIMKIMVADEPKDNFITFIQQNLEKLVKIIDFMIFEPQLLDLPVHETARIENGRKVACQFLSELIRCESFSDEFKQHFISQIRKTQLLTLKSLLITFETDIRETTISYERHCKTKGLIMSFAALPITHSDSSDFKTFQSQLLRKIFNSLMNTVGTGTEMQYHKAINPNPSVKEYVMRLLKVILLSNDNALSELKNYLFDSTELVTDVTVVQHGSHFVTTYKKVIMEFICSNCTDFVEMIFRESDHNSFDQILEFLCDLAEFAFKRTAPEHGVTIRGSLVQVIKRHLPEIFNTARTKVDSELKVVNLISHVMMIFNEEPIYKIDGDGLIQAWFMEVLGKDTTLLDVKTKMLVVLPCFTGPLSKIETEVELDKCLVDNLQEKHFPLQSHELKEGSIQRDSYVACFQAILEALVATKSPVILMFVIKISAADPKHIIEYELRQAIEKYASNQTPETLLADQEMIFKLFCDHSYTHEIRLTILKRFLLGVFKASSHPVLISLYKKSIKEVMSLVKRSQSGKHFLIDKIGGYQLLEILFGICTKEFLESPESPIFDPEQKKPVSLPFIVACRDEFKISIINPDPETFEYFRKAQCAAFNCLCTVLANHQTNQDLYHKLLFQNPQIWSNLITDIPEAYQMNSQEIEDYPVIRKRIVAIRDIKKVIGIKENRHFHMTTSIYASSLSQDVLRLDFSNTVVRSVAQVEQMTVCPMTNFGEIALEKVMINDHECMANICAIIHHMHDKNISNFNFKVPWIQSLCDMLVDHPVRNVRRFIAKIIDNCRDVFKKNTATVYPALLKFLIDEGSISCMNSFITDLCVLLLEWSDVYKITTASEYQLATKLMEFLIQKSNSERRDILKVNLEILKSFMTLWKDFLTLPYATILEKLTRSNDRNSKENIYGIHLSAIILSCGLLPWSNDTKEEFFQVVKSLMYFKSAPVYQPAAQLYGMCLKEEFKDKSESDFLEHPSIVEFIAKLKIDLRDDQNNALDIIYGIQKYCIQFLKPFTSLITDKIPLALHKIKLKYLEMFLTAMEFYDQYLYREIIFQLNIRQLLKNSEFKIMGLHIVNRALPLITPTEILFLYSDVVALIKDASSEVREIVYEILIFIYTKLPGRIDLKNLESMGVLLLEGILDTDPDIQGRLIKFWSDPEQLPLALDKRLEKLLCNIYTSEAKNFLRTSTILLLHTAISDQVSALPLFHYTPGEDVKHIERKIDTNWRRNASLTRPPLFVETKALKQTIQTLSSQIQGTQAEDEVDTVPFTPTIDPNSFFTTRNAFKTNIVTQDSFFINTQHKTLNLRSNITDSQDTTNTQTGYSHLRQRFLRDQDKVQREKALKAINYRTSNEQKQRTARQEQEMSVTLYRRYRVGDFPDLNINSLAILLPLQALLRYDKTIARQVFIELYEVSAKIALTKELSVFPQVIGTKTSIIMNSFVTGDPTLIASLLNIAIGNAKIFQISAQSVKNVAKATNNISLGILYLEEQLLNLDSNAILSSRRSNNSWNSGASSSAQADEIWLQLAELNRCLWEHDVLNGIFVNKLNVDQRLPNAINAMAGNQFDRADNLWVEILESMNYEKLEQDFCYQARFDCLAALGSWGDMAQNVRQQFGTMDQVWDNGFNQEVLLPHLMTSETRLILEDIHPNNEFLESLLAWKDVPEKWDYLKQNFSEELSMLMTAEGDFHLARLLAEQSIRNFLLEWANLNIFCDKLRYAKLTKIRVLSEVFATIGQFFLSSRIDQATFETATNFYELALPSQADSTIFWDTIITYRTFFCRKLKDRAMDETLDTFKTKLSNTLEMEETRLFNVALEQGNIGLATNIIDRIRMECDVVQLRLLESFLAIKMGEEKGSQTEKLIELESARERLVMLNNTVHVDREEVLIKVSLSLAKIGELLLLTPVSNHKIYNNYTELPSPTMLDIQNTVISHLKKAIERSDELPGIADCYMKFADFAYVCFESLKFDNKISLQTDIVRYTLQAMPFGHKRARALFPRLLQLPNLNETSISKIFHSEAFAVPDWLFLEWIPQILACLNLHENCCLDVILTKLVRSYPSALIYSLRMTLQEQGDNVRPFLKNILNTLETPLMKKFISELSLIIFPMGQIKFVANNLLTTLLSRPQEFLMNLQAEIQNLYGNVVNQGSEYLRRRKYEKSLRDLLKMDVNTSSNEIRKVLVSILKNATESSKRLKNPLSTEALSPWLANYQLASGTESIPIPGQLTTRLRSRPHNNDLIKIFKIDLNLMIIQSLRFPIKITFHGTDGREYPFLAKYGEDLRQDQRVQQMLGIISECMENDHHCHMQKLKIMTYNVTPISTTFGLMKWVDDTTQLRHVIEKSYERREKKKFDECTQKLSVEHRKFIKSSEALTYAMYARETDRQRIASNHRSVVSLARPDLLKGALLDYASDFEKYYVLKCNFIRSLASMAITNWILGIGDRHLSNILIDLKSFNLIGIDFGHTFGTATRDLPIPELIPFRLTEQMQHVLEPLGVTGLLERCMIHAMRCLRNEQKVLQSCLTLDYLNPNDIIAMNRTWTPETRVNVIKRKLLGVNPVKITLEELMSNRISAQGMATGYQELLRSAEYYGDEENLPVETQVRKLIEQATDEALLGVTWIGWMPYI